MTDDASGTGPPRRPRPTPHGRAVEARFPTGRGSATPTGDGDTGGYAPHAAGPRQQLIRVDQVQPSELVAAAGNAVVTAARLGRLLTRTGWRIARQLPGGETVEREVQRAGGIAARVLDVPQGARPRPRPSPRATPEEHRAALLIDSTGPGESPLRGAMQELLQRSVESDRTSSREYLYGTIMSQLVPDEARILAALSDGAAHAACDVVVHEHRQPERPLLVNASTVGRAAGVTTPDNVPTYLSRLQGLGVIEFGSEDESLATQYEILAADDAVREARRSVARGRRNPSRIVRKTVRLSPLGREFWAAADPSRPALTQG
jgi:hypothetical protein